MLLGSFVTPNSSWGLNTYGKTILIQSRPNCHQWNVIKWRNNFFLIQKFIRYWDTVLLFPEPFGTVGVTTTLNTQQTKSQKKTKILYRSSFWYSCLYFMFSGYFIKLKDIGPTSIFIIRLLIFEFPHNYLCFTCLSNLNERSSTGWPKFKIWLSTLDFVLLPYFVWAECSL